MAAALTYGPEAVVSHRSAAAVWGLRPTGQTRIDVTGPGYGRRSRPKIRVHGTTKLHPEDVATVDGIPVTSIARTLLDLSSTLTTDRLLRVIEHAVQLGLFDLNALDRAIARAPRRSGIKALRSVVAAYREPPRTRSELEREFFDLIRASGLPQPLVNAKLAGLEVDFLWPSGLVVELDGRGYHTSPRAFEVDRIRDAKLQRAGCRVLRITYRRLREDPAGVLADVRALLALAA